MGWLTASSGKSQKKSQEELPLGSRPSSWLSFWLFHGCNMIVTQRVAIARQPVRFETHETLYAGLPVNQFFSLR